MATWWQRKPSESLWYILQMQSNTIVHLVSEDVCG